MRAESRAAGRREAGPRPAHLPDQRRRQLAPRDRTSPRNWSPWFITAQRPAERRRLRTGFETADLVITSYGTTCRRGTAHPVRVGRPHSRRSAKHQDADRQADPAVRVCVAQPHRPDRHARRTGWPSCGASCASSTRPYLGGKRLSAGNTSSHRALQRRRTHARTAAWCSPSCCAVSNRTRPSSPTCRKRTRWWSTARSRPNKRCSTKNRQRCARRHQPLGDGIQRRGMVLALLTKLKQIANHPAHFLKAARPARRAQRSSSRASPK